MGSLQALGSRLAVYWPLVHLVLPLSVCILGFVSAWLASVDVTVNALCHGAEQCAEVIYLTTVKSAVAACGTMFITPWVGGLSDIYGRRPFLMLLFASFSLPYAVLAWSTSRTAVYIYFLVGTLVYMMGDGTFTTLFYAYVADTIPRENRATAFGVVGGLTSIGFLGGTLLTRVLPLAYIFHFAAGFCLLAVVYIAVLMPESLPRLAKKKGALVEEREGKEGEEKEGEEKGKGLTIKETLKVISSSRMLTVVTAVAFLAHIAEAGYYNSFLFYLKAAFHWGKDDFSLVTLTIGAAGALSQLVVLPLLIHFISLRTLLLFGTFIGALHIVLYGAAWAPWVVYVAAGMSSLSGIVNPVIATIVSRCASPDEQGKLQGVVTGIKSISGFIAPLTINPITAAFLSDNPPFQCPGFGLIVAGCVEFVACILVLALPSISSLTEDPQQLPNGYSAISADEESANECGTNGVQEYVPLDNSLVVHNLLPEVEPLP